MVIAKGFLWENVTSFLSFSVNILGSNKEFRNHEKNTCFLQDFYFSLESPYVDIPSKIILISSNDLYGASISYHYFP